MERCLAPLPALPNSGTVRAAPSDTSTTNTSQNPNNNDALSAAFSQDPMLGRFRWRVNHSTADLCSPRIRLSTDEQSIIIITKNRCERVQCSIRLWTIESYAATFSDQQLSVGICSSATTDREQRNDGSDQVAECSAFVKQSSRQIDF